MGTGWLVHPSGAMITNAHVVANAHVPSRSLQTMLLESGVKAACGRAIPGGRVRLDPSISVILSNGLRLPARVAKFSPPPAGEATSGRDLALLQLEAADMPALPLGDAVKRKIGDRVHIIGFPGAVMTHELLDASSKVEASVTSGAISSFKEDVQGQPVIQTDASAAGGDGAPVVDDRGEVIGVLTSVSRGSADGAIVQGFNYVIPALTVRDFLKDTGVALGETGSFNRVWWAGLSAFFAGDYRDARPRLAEANRLLPELPDVRRITTENEERIKNPPPRPFPWLAVGGALILAGAAGCAAAWTRWWQRNRFRMRPREVARLLERGEAAPVLLDVRDSETYRRSPVRIAQALHVPAERLSAGDIALPVEASRPVVAYCT
jgi:hypothetical protein